MATPSNTQVRCNAHTNARQNAVSKLAIGAITAIVLTLPVVANTSEESEAALMDYAYAKNGGRGAVTDVEPPNSAWTNRTFSLVDMSAEELANAAEDPLAAPLEIDPNGTGAWLLWDRETHFVETEMTDAYNPGGDWFEGMNGHHDADSSTVPTDQERRARTNSSATPLVIDLIWASPLDLDLHVFEPSALAGGKIAPRKPGHLWSKAPQEIIGGASGQLKTFPFDAERRLSAERYQLSGARASELEAVQVFVDYSDRTRRQNKEPRTCGNGDYATFKAKLRVTSAKGSNSYPVTIPALPCGTPVSMATAMIPVGLVRYR